MGANEDFEAMTRRLAAKPQVKQESQWSQFFVSLGQLLIGALFAMLAVGIIKSKFDPDWLVLVSYWETVVLLLGLRAVTRRIPA